MELINTVGRRKASVARIYLKSGSGKISINGKDYKDYFPQANMQFNIEDPLNIVDEAKTFDIKVNVKGGGFKGQAEAIRLALARALVKVNEDYRALLKAKNISQETQELWRERNLENQKRERASNSLRDKTFGYYLLITESKKWLDQHITNYYQQELI